MELSGGMVHARIRPDTDNKAIKKLLLKAPATGPHKHMLKAMLKQYSTRLRRGIARAYA